MRGLLRFLCFVTFGVCTFYNPADPGNIFRMVVGAIVGIVFGAFFKGFLVWILGTFNKSFKKEKGKEPIKNAVKNGMMFMVPFAFMILIATFGLKWSQTDAFVSTGIMAVGTAAAIEIGADITRRDEDESIVRSTQGSPKHKRVGLTFTGKNTIATSVACFIFSFIWVLTTPLIMNATITLFGINFKLMEIPSYIEGGLNLSKSFTKGGGI